MIDYTRDGHVHTPFCPHGSSDSLHDYVERALARGVTTLTFTEHAPFPKRFNDPTPDKDSAMALDSLPSYIEELEQIKREYDGRIEIRIGLEIDYLPDFEADTLALLEPFRTRLDETILSQHFLQVENELLPVDFSPQTFDDLVVQIGSFEKVLNHYYKQLEAGLQYAWERLNVTRIGHIDLPIKYQKNYTWDRSNVMIEQTRLLQTIAKRRFELDLNTAGLRKTACQEVYALSVAAEAHQLGIPLVLGSDAHIAADVGADFEKTQKKATFL